MTTMYLSAGSEKGVILRQFFHYSQGMHNTRMPRVDNSSAVVPIAGGPHNEVLSPRLIVMAPENTIALALCERFGSDFEVPSGIPGIDELARIAGHGSHRKFQAREIDPGLLRLLFACALSAPSKSDLQQADIVHVADRARVKAIAELIPDMPWINDAPVLLVFCGNNRRIRQIGDWRGKPFVNDHLDHFMNAAVDAGLVMMTFIRAAEAAGLGACPISAVRNQPREVSRLLGLPAQVFPVAGLAVGYPAEPGRISARLPLGVTVHVDRYDESGLNEKIDAYDRRRHALQPYRRQRHPDRYADVAFYGWSEDKARQYAVPEREDFGAFIRERGFTLK
jgi:FMN reductase [NAD(P)H]